MGPTEDAYPTDPHKDGLPEDERHRNLREAFVGINLILYSLAQSPERQKALDDLTTLSLSALSAVAVDIGRKN